MPSERKTEAPIINYQVTLDFSMQKKLLDGLALFHSINDRAMMGGSQAAFTNRDHQTPSNKLMKA